MERIDNIAEKYIESEKELLSRPDGFNLTDIEPPAVSKPYVPPSQREEFLTLRERRSTPFSFFGSRDRFGSSYIRDMIGRVERDTDHLISNDTAPNIIARAPIDDPSVRDMLDKIDSKVSNIADGVVSSFKRLTLQESSKTTLSDLSEAVDTVVPETKAVQAIAQASSIVEQAPIADPVVFSPFKINVWKRDGSGLVSTEEANNSLRGKTIPVGRYLITLKTPVGFANDASISGSIPFMVDGKQAVLEKVRSSSTDNKIIIQVRIVQNFVLIASVVTASLLAGGYLVGNLTDLVETSVESVDRVVETSIVVAIAGGVGWYALKKFGVL